MEKKVIVNSTIGKEPSKVFTASNGVTIELFGQMDIEALSRSIYGIKQQVKSTDKKTA